MSSGFEVISVSQLNYYVRSQLDGDPMLHNIFLRGEISNFNNHYRSGHYYLSLKDDSAVIKAVMFRNSAQRLPFVPENGMKVIVMGRATLYDRDGQFQFYIDDMQPDGVGALHIAFEQLKAKLESEGLFARSRLLPAYPEKIGIVTSPTGAALQDILNILKRRFPVADVLLYPVSVQGDLAPAQLCAAIDYFSREKAADVLIVGRGGGSIEELWAFNDENVARSIATCSIPVVSAVGHETDFTIADFAADMRAPTPSAAAELVSPDITEVSAHISYLNGLLARSARQKLEYCAQRLDNAASSRAFREPVLSVAAHRANFDSLKFSFDKAVSETIIAKQGQISMLMAKLDSLSPIKVLLRGYTMASNDNGVITGVGGLEQNQKFKLTFCDGEADCETLEIRKKAVK